MSIYDKFARTWDDDKKGFGRHSYNDAISAGYTPAQIAAAVEGKRVGVRGQELIDAYKLAANTARESGRTAGYSSGYDTAKDDYRDQIDDYKERIRDYKSDISDYDDKIEDFRGRISDYKLQVGSLTDQYNTALSASQALTLERDDLASKFREASQNYEASKAEADRYREEAVGQQLRGVRAGSTAGGANQTNQMRGSLASGRTGYSSDRDEISELAESMRSQGGLTDSVLSREGPVVQQLASGSGGSTGGQRQATNRAGTGSYYASRFR